MGSAQQYQTIVVAAVEVRDRGSGRVRLRVVENLLAAFAIEQSVSHGSIVHTGWRLPADAVQRHEGAAVLVGQDAHQGGEADPGEIAGAA